MEESKIFDLLNNCLQKWREEFEAKDEYDFGKIMHDNESAVTATLTEKQKELLKFYEVSKHNYLDYVYYEINKKVLHFGIQAGMQLQQAFNEQSE